MLRKVPGNPLQSKLQKNVVTSIPCMLREYLSIKYEQSYLRKKYLRSLVNHLYQTAFPSQSK